MLEAAATQWSAGEALMSRMDELQERLQAIEKEILEELHSLREDRG